jgi:dolichol kinase
VVPADEAQALSSDLYGLLRLVDPSAYRDEVESEARAMLSRVVQRARALAATDSAVRGAAELTALVASIDRVMTAAPAASRAFWQSFLREVHPRYEALSAALRAGHVVAPVLRPTNYARSAFHVASALVALGTIAVAPSRAWIIGVAAGFFVYSWSMEIGRRISPAMNDRLMRFYGPVAHAHERHRVNSATWYATALMVLSLTIRPSFAATAVAVLGFADPAAGFVGRRYGKTKLRSNRSLEGTSAFAVVAFVSAFVTLSALTHVALAPRLVCALIGAVAGALAELFSSRIDDNLSVPAAVGAAIALTAQILGVAP